MRFLVAIFFCLNISFAYFVVEDNYQRQARVLKSLDIDLSFFKDSMYISMKEDINIYKTKHFLRILEDGAQFVPILKNMISEAGIPDAFLYLAMAESGFSVKAYSKAKASGLWQFMEPTARKFKLEIDEYIDERRDPIKSTQAAIKYLEELHERFGKWYLAAMAYNCGEGRVSRAIKEAGTDDLYVLLDEKNKYIPAETRRYIRKIVMMAHISENPNFIVEEGAAHLLNSGTNDSFERVEVKGGVSLASVANAIEIPTQQLKAYNNHLNYFFTPPNKEMYHIYIPYNKKGLFVQNFDLDKEASKYYVHVVKKGDNFSKIASAYGVKYKVIRDFNQLKSDNLKLGQKLIIPVDEIFSSSYTIKNGDTLFSISKKFDINIDRLMKDNNLQNTHIYPGAKLAIPIKH